jgi:hypothetical protein
MTIRLRTANPYGGWFRAPTRPPRAAPGIAGFLVLLVLSMVRESAADSLTDAQALFYNGQYAAAAELSRWLSPEEGMLAVHELRTSALLFQIRRAIGEPRDKEKAFKACLPCPVLMTAFMQELAAGQAASKAILSERPADTAALFFLGKLDLNYVWLVLGTLGRRTGWNEYWEARHSLDAVLIDSPDHLRARVARAWIDYIVDTKMPRGTKWMLGGGDKKRGLLAVQQAASTSADFFSQTEAAFALWDMQVREKNLTAAVSTARSLAHDFPDNHELAKFLENHDPNARR